jgi:NADH-quinone oxidoreductase subunit H
VQAGTLSTRAIVDEQAWIDWQSIASEWYWLPALVPFAIFLVAAVAETNHPPFDLVEAEQELVGGFHTEYTGIRFAIFFLAEFMNLITMSAVAVTLFLGGPSGPSLGFLSADHVVNTWLVPVLWFVAKVLVLLFGTVWLRASLPRLRYDRLMALGWKYLIEIAILWVLVSVSVVVAREEGWNVALTAVAASAATLAAYGVLWLAIPKAGEQVEEFR